VTTELTPTKGMRALSAIIIGMESEGETKVKYKESGDIWCEAPDPKPIQNVTYLRNYEATDL